MVGIIRSRMKWDTELFYPDDIIVYSRTVTERIANVHQALRLLQSAGMSLRIPKCAIFDTSVIYLGHVIRPGQLEVETRNVDVIERAKPPTNHRWLSSFFEMFNVYRRFA